MALRRFLNRRPLVRIQPGVLASPVFHGTCGVFEFYQRCKTSFVCPIFAERLMAFCSLLQPIARNHLSKIVRQESVAFTGSPTSTPKFRPVSPRVASSPSPRTSCHWGQPSQRRRFFVVSFIGFSIPAARSHVENGVGDDMIAGRYSAIKMVVDGETSA